MGAQQGVLGRPVHQRQVRLGPAVILEALEHARQDVQLRQNIPQAPGNTFLALEGTAQHAHGDIRDQRQHHRQPIGLAVVGSQRRVGLGRRRNQAPAGQGMHRCAYGVGHDKTHMAKHCAVEVFQGLAPVGVVRRLHLAEHVGMATNQALAKDDQASGHDVRALHRNGDGTLLVGTGEEVIGAHADAFAGDDVHAVVDDDARPLCDVVLGNGRDHRRFLAGVQGCHRHLAHRITGIQMPGHARQRRLYTFELADGQAELLAHRRIGCGTAHRHFTQADVGRR